MERELRELFALNVLLQLFDGMVTYQGLRLGLSEGNPIVAASFATLGVGASLLLFKAQACGMLFLLCRFLPGHFAGRVLWLLAVAYSLCSVAPWYGMLFGAMTRLA